MASGNFAAQFDTIIQEKYIPLDKNIKIVIGVALLIVPVALFYFSFYVSVSKDIVALKSQKVTLETEIAQAEKAAANLDKHKNDMVEAERKFNELTVRLPNENEIPKLLRNISDLGRSAGLDFVSFSPGAAVPKDFYAEIPVNISINGPYHNLGYFLDKVSQLDRIVTVNNIKLGMPKEHGEVMILTSTCKLLTYMFTDKKVTQDVKK